MKKLIAIALLALLAGAVPAQQWPQPYTVKLVLSGLDLRAYPLFSVADSTPNGTPVYMATETFTVWLGQYATLEECQAYVLPANPGFVFFYTNPTTGQQASVEFTGGSNMTVTNYGCTPHYFG